MSGPLSTTPEGIGDLAETPLFQAIWEHFPENMFLIRVDAEGDDFTLEAINPAEATTLGADCAGRRLREILPEATAERVIARYRECLCRQAPIRYEEGDVTYFDPHGVERIGSWLTLLVPLRSGSDRISHLFGISQNITELRLARTELERRNEDLEARVNERTRELRIANEKLQALNGQLEALATRDFLTDVHNRGHLEMLVEHEIARAARDGRPLSLVMLDLDGFKGVNDERGHAAGDALLQAVAHAIQSALREMDLLGRYGGDEFVIVLPDTGADDAARVADRVRRVVTDRTGMTISMGLTQYRAGDRQLSDLISRADDLLLAAKRAGRDALHVADPASTRGGPET